MSHRPADDLIARVERLARSFEFPIDDPVYQRAGRDPKSPTLYAGSLQSPVCVIGRDLGRDEVAAAQPLIGAGGRLVRRGLYRRWVGAPDESPDPTYPEVLEHALLTNTVPYKPPGNKAYAESVRSRFRPFLAELLADHWTGACILTLGNEAFHWFRPYLGDEAIEAFWRRDDRYEAELVVDLPSSGGSARRLRLGPLPHPSPLNARWYTAFPGLLAQRLQAI